MTTGAEPSSQDTRAALSPADPADEAAAAEAGCAPDEDLETEVPAYVAPSESTPPPHTTVAIGPFRVRPAVLAWVVSLAVHGALAVASLMVISWQAQHPRGIEGPRWGDGAPETGMIDSPGPAGGGPGLLTIALPAGPAPSADAPPGLPDQAEANSAAEPVVAEATPEVAPADEDDADEEPVAQTRISASALQGLESLAIAHTPPPAPAHAPSAGANPASKGSRGGANTFASGNPAAGAATAGNPPGPAGRGAGRTGDGGPAYSGRPGSPGSLDGVRGRHGLARPTYPPESRRRGEQGTVVVEIEVLPDGSVGNVRVAADPGYPRLVEAAVAQVKREHFTPLVEDGRAVPYQLTIPYDFRLR